MINRIYTNPIIKKTLAILLICLICFSCFLPAPPAEAIILDTAVAVALTLVVGSSLVAIGVSATTEHEAFDNLVNDVTQHLIDTGIATAEFSLPIINQLAYVPVRIVNAIKDYLFDSGIVYEGASVFDCSVSFDSTNNYSNQVSEPIIGVMNKNSDLYIPVNQFIYSCIPAVYANIVTASNIDISIYDWVVAYCFNGYYFIALANTDNELIVVNNGHPNYANPIAAYVANQTAQKKWQQYIYGQERVYGSAYCMPLTATKPDVTVNYYSEVYYNYGEIADGSICSDEALELNQNLHDNVGIDELYPDWAANEQAYQQANEDVVCLPLTVPDAYSDVYGLTQEQAWAGDIATSLQGVDTNVGTIADSMPGILENTGSIATSVSDVATQVGSLVDFFTGSVAVSSPIEGIAFGDLFEKFPFSLPFELVNALSCWVADPVAPDMIVPLPRFTTASNFEIYEYRVNFADIPNMPLAAAMCRGGWMLLFTIGLYKITSSFIKW